MLPLNYTAGSRKPTAIRVDLKPRHRGSDTAHMRRTARCPSRQLRRTAEMGGYPPFAGACPDGKVAPIPAYSLTCDRIAKPDPHASFSRGCADGRSGRVKRVTLIEITPPW